MAVILGSNHPEKVIEYYGDGSKFGVKITYIYQGEAAGIADAVYRARDFVKGEDFIVYLGDNVVLEGLDRLMKIEGDASILLARVENPNRFGVALVRDGRIVKLVEKPKERISDLALVGVYAFTSSIFEAVESLRPSWRGELEITDAIQRLLEQGRKVSFHVIDAWWKDTGTPEDLLEANMTLLDRFLKREVLGEIRTSRVEGRVYVGEGTIVENSVVRGPVHIGDNTVIKDSVIGPFSSIGDGCEVKGGEISNSLVLDGVRLEGISLTDSVVGHGCRITKRTGLPSRGSKLVIGENSIVEF